MAKFSKDSEAEVAALFQELASIPDPAVPPDTARKRERLARALEGNSALKERGGWQSLSEEDRRKLQGLSRPIFRTVVSLLEGGKASSVDDALTQLREVGGFAEL